MCFIGKHGEDHAAKDVEFYAHEHVDVEGRARGSDVFVPARAKEFGDGGIFKVHD